MVNCDRDIIVEPQIGKRKEKMDDQGRLRIYEIRICNILKSLETDDMYTWGNCGKNRTN